MNANQLTQKSIEALQSAEKLARENGNQEIRPLHLACALVTAEGGLIPNLLQRAGANVSGLTAALNEEIAKLPCMPKGRADVLAGGAVLFATLMENLGFERLIVSDRDNLEGYAIKKGLME